MVHITNTGAQKVVSYTSAHITETVFAHMGAIWWGTRGTCPLHIFRRGGYNMPCLLPLFLVGFVFGEVSKLIVTIVTFCVKSFSC